MVVVDGSGVGEDDKAGTSLIRYFRVSGDEGTISKVKFKSEVTLNSSTIWNIGTCKIWQK